MRKPIIKQNINCHYNNEYNNCDECLGDGADCETCQFIGNPDESKECSVCCAINNGSNINNYKKE